MEFTNGNAKALDIDIIEAAYMRADDRTRLAVSALLGSHIDEHSYIFSIINNNVAEELLNYKEIPAQAFGITYMSSLEKVVPLLILNIFKIFSNFKNGTEEKIIALAGVLSVLPCNERLAVYNKVEDYVNRM